MPKRIACYIVIVVVLFSVTAFAQTSQGPTALLQCMQSNQAAHNQVVQQFQQARSAGRISPAEQQAFQSMEQRLNAIRTNISRNGLTLPECQQLTREIATERANVQRMASTPATNPQLTQCVQSNQAAHNQVVQQFQQARSAGRISPAEQQAFQSMEQRLNTIRTNISRNGLTLPECQQLTREIATERANVQRMASTPATNPQLTQCVQSNQAAHNQVVQQFQQARSAGRISPAEQQAFQSMEQRLNTIRTNISRNGLTLPECQQLTREIATERANVQRMASTPATNPQLTQCMQSNQAAHNQVVQQFQQARSAGRISPAEQQAFQSMEQRLNTIRTNISRNGLTLPECQQLTREIATERANVQRMASTPATNPQLTQCMQSNQAAHNQVVQQFQQARSAGRISPAEQQAFQSMEQRLNTIRTNISRNGLTLPECQQLTREIATERANVQRMASTPATNPQLTQCMQSNQAAHNQVVQQFQQARSAGRISPAEQQAFQSMEQRLNTIRTNISRNGLTLPECQQLTREIATERANVQRMASTPATNPQLTQCMQSNQAAHNQVVQQFQQARSAGRISPAEQQAFQSMEQRLNTIRTNISRNGLTLPECQQLTREIATERANVQRMASTPATNPQLTQCMQSNQAAHNQVVQQFQQARSAGRISPAEQQAFQSMEQRLNTIRTNISRNGLTLPECQQLTREIATERANVQRMSATAKK